jgi:DNA topoisomerase-1
MVRKGGKHLVIVESPAKAKTINKYLGDGYVVRASMGHVRDLPSKGMGVDLKTFEPDYEVLQSRSKVIGELKKLAKESDKIYLATDLDREGEAIAWHLKEALGIPDSRVNRVIFNAITKSEIQKAFLKPHSIDIDRVNAQRRGESSTGSWGTRSARCCGARSPRDFRPGASSRWRCG